MYFVFILKVPTVISDQNVTMDHSKHLANIMDEGGDMCEKISGFIVQWRLFIQYHFSLSDEAQKVFLISIVLAKNGSAKSSENPIDDLHE